MVRISHWRKKCIGCNACVEAAPMRWRISRKDGKSVLVGGVEKKGVFLLKTEETHSDSLALKNCPVRIIRMERVNG